jgi:hypothetical protein
MHADNLLHSVGISLQQQTIRSQKPGSEPSKIASTVFYWLVECQKKLNGKTPRRPFLSPFAFLLISISSIKSLHVSWTFGPHHLAWFRAYLPCSSHSSGDSAQAITYQMGGFLAEKNMKRCRHCFLVQESSN